MPISDYLWGLRQKVGTALLLIPAVTIVCRDEHGRVLLARHHDYDQWALPGGSIDPGEKAADAAVREMWEETGLLVEPVRLQGVYSGPAYNTTYPNGDRIASVDVVFECRVIGGALAADQEEISELRYFSAAELAALKLPAWAEIVLADLSVPRPAPCFQPAGWTPPTDGIRHGGISPYIQQLRRHIGPDLLLLPAVGAVIFDQQGNVLLQQRTDNGRWSAPVGGMEPSETPADAIVREVWEETGVIVEPVRVIGIYGSARHPHTHPNGDQTLSVTTVFQCRVCGGTPTPDGIESLDVQFFPIDQALVMLTPHWQQRLTVTLAEQPVAQFDPPTWRP